MSSWQAFEAEEPALASEVRARMDAHVHKVVATLRSDGSPRLCGSELVFHEGELWLAGMVGARRFADLRRDPRVAVHSCPQDSPAWSGDARLAGTAVEVTDPSLHAAVAAGAPEPPDPFELFRVDLTEVVTLRLSETGDGLVIDSWRPGRGVRTAVRR